LYWDYKEQKLWNNYLDEIRHKIELNSKRLSRSKPGSSQHCRDLEEAAQLQQLWEVARTHSIENLTNMVNSFSSIPGTFPSGGPLPPTSIQELATSETLSELIELSK
jgi:uncharacterized Zn finger protein